MPNRFTWKTGDVVITKAQESAENKFNPSQPRDKDGQWSDGGGASKLLHNNTLPDYSLKAPDGYTILYTNTKEKSIDSILKNGLKTGQKLVGYGASPEEGNVIWTDTRSPKSTAFGGNTIAFKVKTSLAESSKVNDTQHAVPSDVKPKDILFVDRVIQPNSGVKVSNLPEYASKYGKEKTADVIGKTGTISREDTLQLIEMYEAQGKNNLGNKTENYSPSQPRDKDGQWTDGGGGGISGKAVMSEAAAKEATKDSKYKEVLFHGTSGDNAKSIANEGFESKKNREDTLFGQGTYLTPNNMDARSYAVGRTQIDPKNPPQIIRSYIDTKNPYVVTAGSDPISDATNKTLGVKGYKTDADGYPTNIPKFIEWQKEYSKNVNKLLETHDAIILEQTVAGGNPMVIVGDTSKIKIFKIEHANEALKI